MRSGNTVMGDSSHTVGSGTISGRAGMIGRKRRKLEGNGEKRAGAHPTPALKKEVTSFRLGVFGSLVAHGSGHGQKAGLTTRGFWAYGQPIARDRSLRGVSPGGRLRERSRRGPKA